MPERPEPTTRPRSSVLTAGLIALAVVAYFAIGTIGRGEVAEPGADPREPFTVLVRRAATQDRAAVIALRGRTEAGSRVAVRAEAGGRVIGTPTREGALVDQGDVLCRLEDAGRSEALAEAQALAFRARDEADATERLHAAGFAADARRDEVLAALKRAEAALARAQKASRDAELRAPIAGTLSSLPAEPGDVLAAGGVCAVVSDLATVVVAGELGAAEAAAVRAGDPARVTVQGETTEARVRFVSAVADPRTRAFRVELNADRALRDGLAATASIETDASAASLVPRGALVLADDGRVGVRVVEGEGMAGEVAFVPVSVIGEDGAGVFVAGLWRGARVIVRGQDYVSAGTTVRVAEATE